MTKVLLISSYKVSCGIATYTETLETLLEKDFDLTVHALDQEILRSRIPHVVAAGDRQIRELCARLKDYDVVNLQWEPGLLGDRQDLMAKRFEWLMQAADNLILTVHTVVPYPKGRSPIDFLSFVRRKGFARAYQYFLDPEPRYRRETYRILHERAKSGKKTAVAVHTERERLFFQNVVGFTDVFDHPLSLIHADWPRRLERDSVEARKELEELYPGKKTFIGMFGFISEYKGLHTAIRSMQLLDDQTQLLIYGGVHPGNLKEREPVNAYLKTLMSEIEADLVASKRARLPKSSPAADAPATRPSEGDARRGKKRALHSEVRDDGERHEIYEDDAVEAAARFSAATASGDKQSLYEKVSFLGSPDDYDFALAMGAVDICLFPYLEVGQSGSGPASIAIQMGKKTILTRTRAFIELAKYYPKHFEMVDVGNHLQLAQTIERLARRDTAPIPLAYTNETLAAFYGQLIRDASTVRRLPRAA